MAIILVLDDRPTNREYLTTLLGYAGHRLLEASTAESALTIITQQHPDLVIADILMPNTDGFAFVRQLRETPLIAQTRVIFYTATYVEAEMRSLAQACGVEHFIIKPAEPEFILATVESALGVAPPPLLHPNADFEETHQRLLLDKLAQKVDELEAMNAELETRVAERTTELAEANARLKELNAFKDNLLASTSHDLRSPLGAINSMAELLLEPESSPTAQAEIAASIAQSSRRLLNMVNAMLDLSRLESGVVELDCMKLYASDIVRQTIATIRYTAQAKKINLELQVEAGELEIVCDWLRITQVVSNVLSNAIKFTLPGGTITTSVRPWVNGVRIEVRDTGLGIPAKELPFIFDKFRQVHTRGTENEQGSGLGLAITRQLVELHHGTIDVSSIVGHGTSFQIFLPATQPTA